ncbi:MAG: ATP-binding protein [Planctomycetes bacterium]|nr:ATP-binding protein [Planctomycetota bacterium]
MIADVIGRPVALIQVIRGPRQVGKTTSLYQLVEAWIEAGNNPLRCLLIRFDLQPLREAGLLELVRWHEQRCADAKVRGKSLLLLDEVHKLPHWDEQVKHVFDTAGPKLVLTGSSSVLVVRGQRESLAGRTSTLDFPPFLFREVLEAWKPAGLDQLPEPISIRDLVAGDLESRGRFEEIHCQPAQRLLMWRRALDRYYNRGGYPRLHSGEVDDDHWADYLVETVFDRVLGVDIPDLFPVDQPQLLRHIYLELARRTGQEVSQGGLAQDCTVAGFRATQPLIGRYIHYLAGALLIREYRRYPLAHRSTARVPVKITLSDLGVRNAIFRGAPSLWKSPPEIVGPLVETLVQTVLRGIGLQIHFFRDFSNPDDRRSAIDEVDFVAEALDGTVLPIEVKFRKKIERGDVAGLLRFMERFRAPYGIVVTRDQHEWKAKERLLFVPLLEFLMAF